MYISKYLYEDIFNRVKNTFPEMGGILGGREEKITHIFYDRGIQTGRKCSYTPDVFTLNEVIESWNKNEIEFYGLFHTHCYGSGTLSEMDKTYIKDIMENMPEIIEKLYFPIIIFPQEEMVAYVAMLKEGQLIIREEKILIE